MSSVSVPIKLFLGRKSVLIHVDENIGLDSTDIQDVLEFSAEQLLYLRLIGLKNRKTGLEIPLKEEFSLVPGTTGVSHEDIKNMEIRGEYDLLFEDLREKKIKYVEEGILNKIKTVFDSIDFDKNGMISLEELQLYFENKRQKKMMEYRKIIDNKIEQFFSSKEKWEQIYKKKVQIYQRECEGVVELFKKLDVDNSGYVTWNEFLLYQTNSKQDVFSEE